MNLLLFGVVMPWLMLSLFIALGAWVGFQLIHQNGRLLSRLEALEQRLGLMSAAPLPAPSPQPAPASSAGLLPGSLAPAFELPDLNGRRHSLAGLRGRKLLLVFFNPRCGYCTQMAADLAALPANGDHGHPVPVIVTTGDADENRKLVEEYGLRCLVLMQNAMEVAAQYQCNGTPMGYLIDELGKVASELAVGAPGLLALVNGQAAGSDFPAPPPENGNGAGPLGGKRSIEESQIQRNGLEAGTPAPNFRLPLLYGGELALEEYRGRQVLLVFSDPHCGPCDQLAPQLERQYRASAAVQVLMVSRGELEANRAKAAEHGLTFPVVLQRQWEVSREYGMFATPIAYLIAEDGAIARDVAVGVEPILALLSTPAVPTNGSGPAGRRAPEPARRR